MKKLLLLTLLVAGCAPYRRIQTQDLYEGLTMEEVTWTLRKRPDKIVARKQYPQGQLEVYRFASYEPWFATLRDEYYLYFMNDTLIRYAPPEEWQEGAEKAITKRYAGK